MTNFSKMWTKEEDRFVHDLSLSNLEVAELTGRSYEAVKLRRINMGLKIKTTKNKPFSRSEITLIKNLALSNKEIASRTGRSSGSIFQKRRQLGLTKPRLKVKVSSRYYSPDEIEVLSERIDLTHAELGRLLGRSAAAIALKRKALGLRHAESRGYSSEEMQLLRDRVDLTNSELATLLGRSSVSVERMRRIHGIRGKREPGKSPGRPRKNIETNTNASKNRMK